jgi:hypothetical protein
MTITRWNIMAAFVGLLIAIPAAFADSGFFIDANKKTASAATAIDSNGGMHMAYVDALPVADHPKASYRYCASGQNCTLPEQWAGTDIGDRVTEVQLAVNALGQPRLLLRVASEQRDFEYEYHYAECNADCTSAASWKTVMVRGTFGTSIFDLYDDTSPQRYFALDPQGRPRFIYIDRNYPADPDHIGSYYVWCDAECTTAENWRETLFTNVSPYDFEPVRYPSLTFTRSGAPRIVAGLYTISDNEPSGLYYFSCDMNCDQREGWQRVYLSERGGGTDPSWDLKLDAQGRPRIAFYLGYRDNQDGEFLVYLWCDTNCLNSDNWFYNDVGLPYHSGRHPALALTPDDKPRIAYMNGNTDGLGYLRCDEDCETDYPQWISETLDTASTLAAEYPVPLPPTCDAGLWTTMTPVLSLDGSGNPFLAYDAEYDTRCWYQDPTRPDSPEYRFSQLWRTVRGVIRTN